MDLSSQKSSEKKACFVLFGKPILTEQQIASCGSSDSASEVVNGKSTLDGCSGKVKFPNDALGYSPRTLELRQDTGHCKVFLESEDVGRTLDLTILGSYDELYRKLTDMFGIEKSEMLSHVLYEGAVGGIRRVGNELFSDFIKIAKRINIFVHPRGGGSSVARSLTSLFPSMPAVNAVFKPAAKAAAGPLSTYA